MSLVTQASGAAMPSGVQSFVPSGVVPDNVSFRIVFKNPVVTKKDTGKSIKQNSDLFPIEIVPLVQIEGRWQNERTFTAKLLSPLQSATSYTATLKDLRDRKGNKIGPGSFKFQTEGLKPEDIRASMTRDGRANFDLNFNMKVDPARLKGFMKIINPKGKEIPYTINGALPGKMIRVSFPVDKVASRQRFTVNIAAGLKSSEGDLGITRDYSESVVLDPELIVQGLYPDENSIRVPFNFGIDAEIAKSFITVEPAVNNLRIENSYSDEIIYLRSDEFKPRDRFVITFKKGFPAKGGIVLKEDFKQAVIMPDLDSEVNLASAGTYLTSLNDALIPVELLNVKRLQIDLWRLYENNIPFVVRGDYDSFKKDLAQRVYTKEINLSLPLNERVRKSIPVSEMAKDQRGLFLLTIRDADKPYWAESSQMINLSDIGVVARLWEDGVLIWTNKLTEQKEIAEANVKIYSSANQIIAEGKTDLDGIFYFDLKNKTWDEDNQPALAVISKTDENSHTDLTYVELRNNLLDREIFDTSGRAWIKSGYDAEIISPRDIYRTGETAEFKAIVRNPDLTTPEAFPVLFTVRDSIGRKVIQEPVTLNDRGSAVFKLNLPNNAVTGSWNVALTIPGNDKNYLAVHDFHVEDFAPPRIEVKLSSTNEFLYHKDIFTADIYSRWLFGVDGAGLKYDASWTAREANFVPESENLKAYTFGDPDRRFSYTEGFFNSGNLDNFGAARLDLTLSEQWEAPTAIDVTIKAEVIEDSGRPVANFITRRYFPAKWLLGIAPLSGKLTVRNDLKFSVKAIDPKEKPIDPGELNAEFFKVSWNYNLVEIDGYKRWQSSEELTKIDEKSLTLKNGTGEISFKPESYGTYLVKISDQDDSARAVYRFYADDPKYAGGSSQLIDRVEIETDKEFYEVGDTAKIKVKAPFEGLLLTTVEGSKLFSRRVQAVKNSETVIEIPVTQNFEPNAWFTAWLIRPVQTIDANAWASHRAIGIKKININLSSYKIDVAIEAPEKIEPAKKLPVTIKLKALNRRITKAADVSVALVDDGVLNLTHYKVPDLLNYFWGVKRLNSEGFDIYDQLIPIEDRATEQLRPGGDMSLAALAGGNDVKRFKILSLANFTASPDENGNLKIDFDVPEFSGRGKLFVVAASGKYFGSAEQNIQIAREVVTEAGLPRFAAPGDGFVIPVTIFNTANNNKDVKIEFVPEGMTLDSSNSSVSLNANDSKKISVQAHVLDGVNVAKLKIITSWQGNSFTQDFEMPVRSAWPVTTIGGSGIFDGGENRLSIPVNEFYGDISGSLTLADTPAVNLTRAAEFLLSYPYACLEQTISTAWPFLVLPDAISEIDSLLVNNEDVKRKTQDAVTRIQAMQLYDGSFSMWPGSGTPYNWGSVYAAHFLLSAKAAGINYPEDMLNGVLSWLRQFLASMPEYKNEGEEYDDLTAKAYAVYVLALNNEKPLGWIEYLRENINTMWPSGKIYLAGAQAIIEGKSDALRNLTLGTQKISGYRTLESEARNLSILLTMWLNVDPAADEVHELAERLAKLSNASKLTNTQDNAAALMALARYNSEVNSSRSNIKARLTTETSDEALLKYEKGKPASISLKDLKDGNVIIEAEGEGSGYYSWSITGNSKARPKPERKNIFIECNYYDEQGNAIDITQPVKHGLVIQLVLNIRPAVPVNYLAVNYLLPAGLEIENPRINDGDNNYSVFSDIRDDRLILFFDRLTRETSYGIKLRAVTKGTFAVPQVSAFGMYDPAVRFTGRAQSDLVIK